TIRCFPPGVTPCNARANPASAAVNQISLVSLDQPRPCSPAQPSDRILRSPPDTSTTDTEPRSSPRNGCSRNATELPLGDRRGWRNPSDLDSGKPARVENNSTGSPSQAAL